MPKLTQRADSSDAVAIVEVIIYQQPSSDTLACAMTRSRSRPWHRTRHPSLRAGTASVENSKIIIHAQHTSRKLRDDFALLALWMGDGKSR
jgi:hypothetical protein